MKKIGLFILAFLLLTGCSNKKEEVRYMLTRDDVFYALYNQDGKRLTEYSYKTFQEIEGVGFVVTTDKNEKGFISIDGDEIIKPGTYETLEAVDQMLYATKKVEKQPENKDDKKKEEPSKETVTKDTSGYLTTNFFVLNDKGEVLYSADDKTSIKKSGLPVIKKDKEFIVLYKNGKELYKGTEEITYANQYENSQICLVGQKDKSQVYYFNEANKEDNFELEMKTKGQYKVAGVSGNHIVLNDETLKSMIYIDRIERKYYQNNVAFKEVEFEGTDNIIIKNGEDQYVYQVGKALLLMDSYYTSPLTYVSRSNVVYGPHDVYKDGKLTGQLENCQLHPQSMLIYSEMFPVYVRNKGYQYYNFNCKQAIDKTFLEANPFDENTRAIVKINDAGYSLIDETGKVLTKEFYSQIKYIGSSYYAVYNETGIHGIVNKEGEDIFPLQYTTLPEQAIAQYNEKTYMILCKNGRSFVYDIEDDMNVIFSQEGYIKLNEKGYFEAGKVYYTFTGELIK